MKLKTLKLNSLKQAVFGAGLAIVMLVGAFSDRTANAVEGLKMYQVTSGYLELDKSFLTANRDAGTIIQIPVAMYIIDHPRGLVLYDTGNADEVSDGKCASYWGSALCGSFSVIQRRDEVIDRQLEKLGYNVDDVKYIIYSHMHLDHAGNMELFPNATHIVQRDEIKAAWWPEKFQRGVYQLQDFDQTRNFKFMELEGDFDLFSDDSLTILRTTGHTQGHQSLMVRLPKTGTLILSGDAVFSPENENGAVPGVVWDTDKAMRSIDRIKMIRDSEQAELWFTHHFPQYNQHKHDEAYE